MPALEGKRLERCNHGTKILEACISILWEIWESGGSTSLEHPEDPGTEPFPSIWVTRLITNFEAATGSKRRLLDQCSFGALSRKPTCISMTTDVAERVPEMEKRCICTGKHKKVLIGLRQDGLGFVSTSAARYPWQLNLAIAARHSEHCRAKGPRRLQATDPKTFELFQDTRETARKTRVPPLGELWRSKERFQECFRTTWSWTEPSNIVEARTIALAVQGLARSTKNWGKRLLLATDNLAALGALGKGRSSSMPLKMICKKMAAYLMATGMKLYLRWVPSVFNFADGPSRGWNIRIPELGKAKEFREKEKLAEAPAAQAKPVGLAYHG